MADDEEEAARMCFDATLWTDKASVIRVFMEQKFGLVQVFDDILKFLEEVLVRRSTEFDPVGVKSRLINFMERGGMILIHLGLVCKLDIGWNGDVKKILEDLAKNYRKKTYFKVVVDDLLLFMNWRILEFLLNKSLQSRRERSRGAVCVICEIVASSAFGPQRKNLNAFIEKNEFLEIMFPHVLEVSNFSIGDDGISIDSSFDHPSLALEVLILNNLDCVRKKKYRLEVMRCLAEMIGEVRKRPSSINQKFQESHYKSSWSIFIQMSLRHLIYLEMEDGEYDRAFLRAMNAILTLPPTDIPKRAPKGERGESSVSGPQASTIVSLESASEWTLKDKKRMLHVVYRVGDLERPLKFYTECLEMKLLGQNDNPIKRYASAFLRCGLEEDNPFVIEVTCTYGVDMYTIGTGFGFIGIVVGDVAKTVGLIKAVGGKVIREPGPINGGGNRLIALIKDPNGYTFQLSERGPIFDPLCQVMLRVGDFDRAINFYEKAFGMRLVQKQDNPENKYTRAMMSYSAEDKSVGLELTYNYEVFEYDNGNAYAMIAIGSNDVYKTAEAIKLFGGKIIKAPGPLPLLVNKITASACFDPDGWKTVCIDNMDFLNFFK